MGSLEGSNAMDTQNNTIKRQYRFIADMVFEADSHEELIRNISNHILMTNPARFCERENQALGYVSGACTIEEIDS